MSLDIPACALAWAKEGQGAILATVVETWGSAPRPVGSQMAIRGDGHMEGSVSGGCVEGAVIGEAIEALAAGEQRLLEYGVSDDDAFAVGLACGGRIRVLLEPVGAVLPVELLDQLVESRRARVPVAYVLDLSTGARRLAPAFEYPDRFRRDNSGLDADGQLFVAVHNPPLRMIIVGAVHIAQALLPMAQACGYDVSLVDPRAAFGSTLRFPGQRVYDSWPDEALVQIGLDARTCVVTLTHDPKLDDPAIKAALGSDVFYLGCLGSARTHAKRVERLRRDGMQEAEIERIHGPVGLSIGSRSPAEIAVSIMAQVTQSLRQNAGAIRPDA